jgi:NTE family protein
MKKCLAFVLGGGGARGALEVGALRALLEAGYEPDLLVGTSIGAVNAVGLALWGMNKAGIERLEQAYQHLTASRLMDPRLIQFAALGVLSDRPSRYASRRVRDFFIAEGITPDLCFGQFPGLRLGVVGTDLDSGETVIYGQDPEQSILQGLMASIALPLWFAPVEEDGHAVIDGGVLSNLPIESALKLGATEIIALDLNESGALGGSGNGHGQYLEKLLYAITRRQVCLELELAEARGVPVRYVNLKSSTAAPIWDFRNHLDLFNAGYEIMQRSMSGLQEHQPKWWLRLVKKISQIFAKHSRTK